MALPRLGPGGCFALGFLVALSSAHGSRATYSRWLLRPRHNHWADEAAHQGTYRRWSANAHALASAGLSASAASLAHDESIQLDERELTSPTVSLPRAQDESNMTSAQSRVTEHKRSGKLRETAGVSTRGGTKRRSLRHLSGTRRSMAASSDARTLLAVAKAWGTSFVYRATWSLARPCSTWYGVACKPPVSAFNVVAVNLANQGLRGPLSPLIGNLASLTRLNLSSTVFDSRSNAFTGAIPPTLNKLRNLRVLLLQNSGFNGAVPAVLSGLTQLQIMSLAGNALTGAIPKQIASLRALAVLDLGYNYLSGRVPPELGSLRNLNYLALYGNSLTGPIPPQLGNLLSLTYLVLGANSFTGTVPSALVKLRRLQVLDLGTNKLTGRLPPGIFQLTNLYALALPSNSFVGAIPASVGNLLQLNFLAFGGNALSGSIPAVLGRLTSLELLDLSSNRLSGRIPPTLAMLTGLTWLALQKNALSGMLPNIWPKMRFLQYADVSFNQLTGMPPLPKTAVTLNLTSNYFTGPRCMGTRSGLNCFSKCTGQRTASVCMGFCGTTKASGACTQKGICSLVGPKQTPTCSCVPGYKRPATNPGTCVKAKSRV